MKSRNLVRFLCIVVSVSFLLILFRQNQTETIQSFVTNTQQQLQSNYDNIHETKTLEADEKYLALLGFGERAHLFGTKINVTVKANSPVIISYVMREGDESQAVGLVINVARYLPSHSIYVYNLGLEGIAFKTLISYCNSSKCQVLQFNLNDFPSHVEEVSVKAYRPIIIQDALFRHGVILFMENSFRMTRDMNEEVLARMVTRVWSHGDGGGILAWPMAVRNPISSLTHKKMFEYFGTNAENFLFTEMVSADILLVANMVSVHQDVMLPWVQCALIADCIEPIGAQSGGCRFDKKPQYRYTGCHMYDTSALNIVLGQRFKQNVALYTYNGTVSRLFESVELSKAQVNLKELEQNVSSSAVYGGSTMVISASGIELDNAIVPMV